MKEKKHEMERMREEEKTSEVWVTEEEERMEKASADLLKEEYGKSNVIINPPTAGGKLLKVTEGMRAAGAVCGYPSKKCE